MLVREVMTKNPHYLKPEEHLTDAAKEMKKLHCGIIPVGDGNKLLGMVTDRDITIRAIAAGKNPETTTLQDVMTPDVWYCYEDDDVQQAVKSMQNKQVKRLVVLDHDKQMTGILTLGDISRKIRDQGMMAKMFSEVYKKAEH